MTFTNLMQQISASNGDDLDNLIKSRVNELEANAPTADKLPVIFQGYIGNNTLLKPSPDFLAAYTLKGIDYADVVSKIKNLNEITLPSVLYLLLNYPLLYFGPYKGGRRFDRIDIINQEYDKLHPGEDFYDSVLDYKRDVPISIFKGKSKAECLERAALLQNCLSFCGLDTYICFGYNPQNKDAHAFNVLHANGQYYYLDTSYMEEILSNGKVSYIPNVKQIPEEQFQYFQNGVQCLSIPRRNVIKTATGTLQVETSNIQFCRFDYRSRFRSPVEH